MSEQIFAGIDLGSNTVRVLIGEHDDSGRWSNLVQIQRITRLSGSFDQERRLLHPESLARTRKVLSEFVNEARKNDARRIFVASTGIARKAVNSSEIFKDLQPGPDLEARVISDKEEAEWTARGALFTLGEIGTPFLLVDVGGTSTELTIVNPEGAVRFISLDLGAVAPTEQVLRTDPPTHDEMAQMIALVRSKIEEGWKTLFGDRVGEIGEAPVGRPVILSEVEGHGSAASRRKPRPSTPLRDAA